MDSIINLLARYVTMMKSGELKTKNSQPFRKQTIKSYQFAYNSYARFGTTMEVADMNGKTEMERKRIAKAQRLHFESFNSWMIDEEFSPNTRSAVMNVIGIVLRYWSEELLISIPKVNKVPKVDAPIITLPVEFVKRFVNDDRYDSFSPEHRFLWEVCATMLVTSMRISDAITLSRNDLYVDQGVFIVKENQKTGATTTLPLPSSLYQKFLDNIEKYGDVYTPIKQDRLSFINKNLKSFMSTYEELNQEVSFKSSTPEGVRVTNVKKLCDIVHPHMLRKTAITTMLSNGVSEEHVRFASGHKSDAIKRYIGWVERMHKSEINNYYENFLNN